MTWANAIKLAAAVIAVAIAVTVALMCPLAEWLEDLVQWVRSRGVWGPIVYAAIYGVASAAFVPASWLTLAAGYAFGTMVGATSAMVGGLLGASASFFLGHTLARHFVERHIKKYPRFAALDRGVSNEGLKIVLLVRLTPALPFAPLNYAFGVTRVRFRHVFVGSLIGMLPGCIMYSYLGWVTQTLTGAAIGGMHRSPAQWVPLVVGLIATIAVSVVITRVARRALTEATHDA